MATLDVIESMKTIQKHGIRTVEQLHVLKENHLEQACKKTGFLAATKMH